MTEAEWLKDQFPHARALLEFLGAEASPRKLRYFLVACAKRVLPADADTVTVEALATAEQFADGAVPKSALKRAREAVTATHPARAKRWPALYSGHIRSVPAWHANREQIVRGAREGAWCAVWSSTRLHANGWDRLDREYVAQSALLRDIFGNPFRVPVFAPEWRTGTATAIAAQMYKSRDFGAMPILADALQDAGCDSEDVLNHCRDTSQVHVRGCWVVDLVLGQS
ncbi:MAG TPA: hypothetical protein VGE74_07650 [Gemmata sp.]